MRSMDCAQSWHSFVDPHRHLLLMMDFDCPSAFRHKKREYIFRALVEFCFQGEIFFLSLEPVEIRLYLGASLCTYFFWLLLYFCWDYHFRGSYIYCFICFLFHYLLTYIHDVIH